MISREEVLKHAQKILDDAEKLSEASQDHLSEVRANGCKATIGAFFQKFAGNNSSFYQEAKSVEGSDSYQIDQLCSILRAFIEYYKTGLLEEISPERQAQIDVVSDFLDQANQLLEDNSFHPGAAAILIGATLEEFLRNWIESLPISLGKRKPSLQNYANLLREEEIITKQDVKDITSWGGIRNHAAHGEWDEVANKKRIELMLEGVNLFMRKYGT